MVAGAGQLPRQLAQGRALYADCAMLNLGLGVQPVRRNILHHEVFHALQCFAIDWWRKRGTMMRVFRMPTAKRAAKPAAPMTFMVSVFVFGFVSDSLLIGSRWFVAAVMRVAMTHFWYGRFV